MAKTKLEEKFPRKIRMQTILIAIGTLGIFAAVVVLVAALLVNTMQNAMVQEAHKELERQVSIVAERIGEIVEERQVTRLEEVINHPEIRTSLKFMSEEGGVVMAAMINPEGGVLIQQFGDQMQSRKCPIGESNKMTGRVPGSDELTWELSVNDFPKDIIPQTKPIVVDGKVLGEITYGLSDSVAVSRVDSLSRRISSILAITVVVVGALLLLTILLLYKAFMRHLILQRKHSEAQHMALIGTLASGLAHEIRNPLHAMNLHLAVAREDLEEEAKEDEAKDHTLEVIGSVQRQISQLNSIVSNFMSYALPGRLEPEEISLRAVLGEVISILEPEFDSRGVEIQATIPDCCLNADVTAFRQALTNILLNASQILEGQENSIVRVTTRALDKTLEINIEDNGPGIRPGEEKKIFEAFVSHRKGGTGFGLAIARRKIREHGGDITAGRSKDLGGAKFTLTLPLCQKQLQKALEESQAPLLPENAPAPAVAES